MTIYEKLVMSQPYDAVVSPNVNVWVGALVEVALNKMTEQQLIDAFQMNAPDVPDMQNMVAALRTGNSALIGTTVFERAEELRSVLWLTAYRCAPYTDQTVVRARLGIP